MKKYQIFIKSAFVTLILLSFKNSTSQNIKSLLVPVGAAPSTGAGTSLHTNIPIVKFSGLGSISNTIEKTEVDPSANIGVQSAFGFHRRGSLYITYNLGSQIDSTTIDSLKLSSLFFPDKSKNGFTLGLSYNILKESFMNFLRLHTIEDIGLIESDPKKYYYFSLEPFIEYSYLKKNIKDKALLTPRIETSTWLLGLRFGGFATIGSNSFGGQINTYYKAVNLTDATYETYNTIFKSQNNNKDLPHGNSLLGVNFNVQINKIILGFTYEELLTKRVTNTDIYGGVFILKATVGADFFEFK